LEQFYGVHGLVKRPTIALVFYVTTLLTVVPDIDTYGDTLAQKDASRVTPVGRGECGSRGRGCQPRSRAAPGKKRPAGTTTGLRATSPAVLGRPGVA